jgi:hypothetical protein
MISREKTKDKLANFAKSRFFIPSLMMLASLSLVAYAVTSVSVSNTVTIVSGARIQIIYQNTPFIGTTCPTSGYSATPSGVSLVEPAGGSANAYLCINNIGTGADNPTIAITGGDPANCGSGGASPCFSVSPTSLPSIPPQGFSDPTTLTISNNYTTPQPSPVAITITVT